jgi:proteic killer suppression protein
MLMIVHFKNKHLQAELESDRVSSPKLSEAVKRTARRRIAALLAAPDERTLRNLKSLQYEKLKGKRKGQRSIAVNDQFRITFQIDTKSNPPTVLILDIEDYH